MMTDPASYEAFLMNHQDMVFSTAVRLLGNAAEAEDVTQEVFLRAWNHYSELKGSPTGRAWLKTVTRNLCINHLQRHRARWTLFTDWAREDDPEGCVPEIVGPDPWEPVQLNDEQRHWVEQALLKLPDHQRTALVLYHFEEMDYAEIAQHLGVSLGKVKTDIFRARETLRKKLQPARNSVGV